MNANDTKTRLLDDIENMTEDELEAVQGFVEYIKANPPRPKGFRPGYDTRGIEVMWRCTECGYMWAKSEGMPAKCPNCGAPKESFYLVEED